MAFCHLTRFKYRVPFDCRAAETREKKPQLIFSLSLFEVFAARSASRTYRATRVSSRAVKFSLESQKKEGNERHRGERETSRRKTIFPPGLNRRDLGLTACPWVLYQRRTTSPGEESRNDPANERHRRYDNYLFPDFRLASRYFHKTIKFSYFSKSSVKNSYLSTSPLTPLPFYNKL